MNIPFLHREEEVPEDISFPQLVFAHYLRQRELYSAAYDGAPSADRTLRGPAEEEYHESSPPSRRGTGGSSMRTGARTRSPPSRSPRALSGAGAASGRTAGS